MARFASFISVEVRRPQCLEGAHTQRQKAEKKKRKLMSGCQGLEGAGGGRDCLVVTGLAFRGDDEVLEPHRAGDCTALSML